MKGQQVQVLSDNVTTVAMINGMGGSSVQLDMVARSIQIEAMEANITLSAKYLAGTLNWRADYLSRGRSTYEWRLHPNLFRLIDRIWGPHHIDRFASITSTQIPVYDSLYWDPQTSGVDALSQTNWGTMNNFVNPPFALIPRILNIIREQKAVATLIAPEWVGQPWYQQLTGMLTDQLSKTTNITQNDNCTRSKKGTVQKQSMAHLRLENLWSARLRCSDWSRRATRQTIHSTADSTLRSYNSYVEKYVLFFKTNNHDFTEEHNISALADFLCQIADSSTRPESCIKSTLTAVSFYFEGLGKPSPAYNSDIKRLTTALIKSGTVKPMSRQKPMPISAFYQLFHLLGDNEKLSMKSLRLKTVTLLALVLMTRPSDLAPKAKMFDPQSMTSKSVVLSLDDIHFNDQGSVTFTFWGIKNDTQRQGFEVSIPPSSDIVMDPVSCSRTYIAKTVQYRKSPDNPLLISLKAPYKAISADTVGSILEESINMAGLGDQGFTAKFRPTGATIAVSQGILPETVIKIEGWKTKEVFLNHYMYGQGPSGFTTNLLSKDS